jgi:aerobic C4-dicarboxylate transport protein
LKKFPLYSQVLLAIFLAVVFGAFFPQYAVKFKILGDVFIKLIKMCVSPIVFVTVVLGIVHSFDLKKIGKIGFKVFIYFEVLTTIALLIGLAVAHFVKPGAGMNVDATSIDVSSLATYVEHKPQTISDFLLDIIPTTIFSAFAEGKILSILFVAIIFGLALSSVKERAPAIINFFNDFAHVSFKIISSVMKFAPFGAFGAMSYTVGKYGLGSLLPLMNLMICFYLTCILFIFVVLGFVLRLCGTSIFSLLAHIKDEIFLVFGTSSSESALPSLMVKMQSFGCPRSIVGLVVPAGYSFNLDGSCIYFTMAILFIAQAFNIDLSFVEIMSIMLVLLITSKGAAGVAGSGFITLAATLSVIDTVPLAGLVLLFGIDRFMSEARSITNLIGNATATVAISKIEKEFN